MKNILFFFGFSSACLQAMTISFDLEELSGSDQSSVVLTNGDFSITIAAEDNQPFRVGNTESGSGTFANRSLFSRTGSAFVLNFSQPVDFFSADFGDFGNDVDTGLLDVLFFGSFVNVDNETFFANRSLSNGDIGNVESFVPEISSVRLDTTGDNSVLWDNFTVTLSAVPEPSILLSVSGAGLLFLLRRSRRK